MLHRSQLVILGEAPDLRFYRLTDEGALTELTDSVPRGRDPYSTSEVPDYQSYR
jgi:hypothetical protein